MSVIKASSIPTNEVPLSLTSDMPRNRSERTILHKLRIIISFLLQK